MFLPYIKYIGVFLCLFHIRPICEKKTYTAKGPLKITIVSLSLISWKFGIRLLKLHSWFCSIEVFFTDSE